EGKLMFDMQLKALHQKVNMIELPPGLYVVKIETVNGSVFKRIVKD
ncbi:MAG: hypothetical protein ACI9JN_001162, partial [Bacteroidia bacterium]